MGKQKDLIIVIGAGQAGLAMGYYLRELNQPFLIVDAYRRVGDAWRQRYDSLTLFTPRKYSELPGMKMAGDPDGYPHKDEVADYLEAYATKFRLPIQLSTQIVQATLREGGFSLKTSRGDTYFAHTLIVATGPFSQPFIPQLLGRLSEKVVQLHTAEYRNPQQLQKGTVMVIGAGNSGVQIATELAETNRPVYLSVGKPIHMLPHRIGGKSLFWWMDILGVSKVTVNSPLGKVLRRNDPIIGREAVPYIKKKKILLTSRAIRLDGEEVFTADGKGYRVKNVIWATGYQSDYTWLQILGVIDLHGNPIHERGVTPIPGLYFLGLSWQYTRNSGLIRGVGTDAHYIKQVIQENRSLI